MPQGIKRARRTVMSIEQDLQLTRLELTERTNERNQLRQQNAELERKLAEQEAMLRFLTNGKHEEERGFEELNTLLAQAREEGRKEAVPSSVFNVFHREECVGTFYQGSFSTLEIAERYAETNKYGWPFEEMLIKEHQINGLLAASPKPTKAKPSLSTQEN